MGCATGMVRIIMFVFNLIFAIAGLALLIVGVRLKLSVSDVTQAVPDGIEVAPTLLIVVGCIIFVIAFFGCCGAIKENTFMLKTYAVILLVIFVIQVIVSVYSFSQIKGNLREDIRKDLQQTYDRYETDTVAADNINILQTRLECCGMDTPFTLRNGSHPLSCCTVLTNGQCVSPYIQRCSQLFYNYIINIFKTIGIVAISITVIEILGAIAAIWLSNSLNNQHKKGEAHV